VPLPWRNYSKPWVLKAQATQPSSEGSMSPSKLSASEICWEKRAMGLLAAWIRKSGAGTHPVGWGARIGSRPNRRDGADSSREESMSPSQFEVGSDSEEC